ncbi:MAG TPA: ABC transporter ATP-binding protein [Burkholderiales bacterium]|nr:ABC transporter ATP-binding protein [Burkholderiales bacterium]
MTSPDTSPAAIDIRGACKTYPNGTRALEPIELIVREGEFVTIVGPSGCGKSTLLRLIAGLSPPTAGSIVLSEGYSPPRLAYVFQSPTLMPWASVQANVRLPLDLAGVARTQADKTTRHALERVGLQDFARSFPRELSGGMQMRASIARALVTGPRLLLMDEPFGALDEITRNRLDREFSELSARENLTVLFVTHSIYEAVFLSSRVLVMSPRPGRIHAEVAIDAPRVRADSFRTTTEFASHSAQLSEMLGAVMQEADQ